MDKKDYEEYVEKFARNYCDGDIEEAKKCAIVKEVKGEEDDDI